METTVPLQPPGWIAFGAQRTGDRDEHNVSSDEVGEMMQAAYCAFLPRVSSATLSYSRL